MDGPGGDVDIEEIPATEAFALLGNETRMETLRALWEADEPTAFSDLRRAVAPDDRGNFDYHLKKLTGHYVRKTEEGYALRFAGEQVVRAVLSGTITSEPSVPPTETDQDCVYCGSPVELSYESEVISVRCGNCGGAIGGDFPPGTVMEYEFPPAALVDRSPEEVIDAAHVFYDSKVTPMMRGICPECGRQIAVTHDVCPDHDPGEDGLCPACDTRYEVWTTFECDHCRYSRRSVLWFAALNHPAVVAFYHEHGLEEQIPIRKLTGENARYVRAVTSTVLAEDPYRFAVEIPVDDEVLRVTLGADLTVLGVERDPPAD